MVRSTRMFNVRAFARAAALSIALSGLVVAAGGCVTRARGERSDLLEPPRLSEPPAPQRVIALGEDASAPADESTSTPRSDASTPPPAGERGGAASAPADAPAASSRTSERPGGAPARQGDGRVRVDVGPPRLGDLDGGRGGDAVHRQPVDAMIGQINGTPIFASDILETMDARLSAEAAKMSREEFLGFARQEIRGALRDRIRDELLLAEARSSLTPEQKIGLRFFMQSVREDLVRGAFGSEELAERRLRETEGLTLDEEVARRRDRELILLQLRKVLANQIEISWRDIQQEYERRLARQSNRPVARLRLIWIDQDDVDAKQRVESALADDIPFSEIASVESVRGQEDGGLYERELEGETYAESRIFGPDKLNERATSLSPGQITGPFEYGSYLIWMTLEDIERPDMSLYEVQTAIRNDLRRERIASAEADYFQRLLNDSSITDISEMERRLLQLALDRYAAQ